MKKTNLFLGLGVAMIAFLFTSCDTTVNPAPDITFQETSPIVLAVGESSTTITGTIKAEAGLELVKVIKMVGLSEQELGSYTSFSGDPFSTTDDINYDINLSVTGVEETITIKIEATDKDGQYSSESIEITPGVNSYTAILMGAQNNASLGSFLDADEGDVYLIGPATSSSHLIDIVYYYGSSNLATLCSPDDPTVNGGSGNLSLCVNFAEKNTTEFGTTTISSSAFDAIASDKDLDELSGMGSSLMTDLSIDDVISFETDGGKKGLIKVTSMETGNSGSITITVKIQQ